MKTRTFNRRPRPPTSWEIGTGCWLGNAAQTVAANTLTDFVLLDTSSVTVTPTLGRMTIQRVVGDFIVSNNSGANQAHCSIGLCLVPMFGGANAVALDPTNTNDAEYGWMWLNHIVLPAATSVGVDVTNHSFLPRGGHVDVKVKRILRNDMILKFVYKSDTACNLFVNCRTLVSRVA